MGRAEPSKRLAFFYIPFICRHHAAGRGSVNGGWTVSWVPCKSKKAGVAKCVTRMFLIRSPPRPPVFNVDLEFFPKRMTKKNLRHQHWSKGGRGEVLYRLRRAAAPLQWQSTPTISTFDGIYACFSHQNSCRDDRGSYSLVSEFLGRGWPICICINASTYR